ncbi:Oidioi.mRNA.OKI2018_I69.YSR.g17115.t1.cds [Oikopleura dioica]|uniref:Oidioi.mRNA.OKI2018_I69.YSR.g17115.t1.cds n=1 Tax=Oikopleura dioica TaxID=34765 RepID=A0ABN7SMF8_OIKDI|nr:Oidioi.mRNA.OKI2018_I69.YSR.g17115.t1.cds [Oikopleura dioica]
MIPILIEWEWLAHRAQPADMHVVLREMIGRYERTRPYLSSKIAFVIHIAHTNDWRIPVARRPRSWKNFSEPPRLDEFSLYDEEDVPISKRERMESRKRRPNKRLRLNLQRSAHELQM